MDDNKGKEDEGLEKGRKKRKMDEKKKRWKVENTGGINESEQVYNKWTEKRSE